MEIKSPQLRHWTLLLLALGYCHQVNAAYLESAIGNAVTNDATSVYYNPSGLAFLKNQQFIGAYAQTTPFTRFTGTTTNIPTNITQTGTASSKTVYPLPSWYYATPLNETIAFGISGLYTYLGKEAYSSTSLLRYVNTYSYAAVYTVSAAMSFRVKENLFVGGAIDYNYAEIELDSMIPVAIGPFRLPDASSINKGYGQAWSFHGGATYRPFLGTILGLTYHSPVSYRKVAGHSTFSAWTPIPTVTTNKFYTKVVTPPSVIFSINQYVSRAWGFIGTIERMNWATVRNVVLRNVATPTGALVQSVQPFYLHNTWRFTLGSHYDVTEQLNVRGSLSYDEAPQNVTTQIAAGDNIIYAIGASYRINKQFKFDFGYAHTDYTNEDLRARGASNLSVGTTNGGRNSWQVKVIWDIV